jgi:hypothetical protein
MAHREQPPGGATHKALNSKMTTMRKIVHNKLKKNVHEVRSSTSTFDGYIIW